MASLKTMSYAEIDLAIVPEAPPAFASDLLAGPDFREGAVLGHVQVYRERLLIRGQEFLLVVHAGILASGPRSCNPFLCNFSEAADSTGGRGETG
jgi:hypothetical protein